MFSDKYVVNTKTMLQKDDIDIKLRIDLWNSLQKFFLDKVYYSSAYSSHKDYYSNLTLQSCCNYTYLIDLYENFFIYPISDMRRNSLSRIKKSIEKLYADLKWYKVYDLIEYVSQKINDLNFQKEVNLKLERNNSAYRLVDINICPITNNTEIEAIQESCTTNFDIVNTHMHKAIQLFSDKSKPDYENVIKESITAVESMCSIIVGEKTTLGDALKKLEDSGLTIHPSLKSSFSKSYGYTSDANGIRHSGDIGGSGSTFSEAKFMLISCSAFINYLIENYSKIEV